MKYIKQRQSNLQNPVFVVTEETRDSISEKIYDLFLRVQQDIDLIISGNSPINCNLYSHEKSNVGMLTENAYGCIDYDIFYSQYIGYSKRPDTVRNAIYIRFHEGCRRHCEPFILRDIVRQWNESYPMQP